MDVSDLYLFLDVAELGGFTNAAKAEGIDASKVSRRIAALEAKLGVRLFERSTRKVTLTEAGAAYRDRISPLLAELSDANDAARDLVSTPKGTLRVSASTAFGQRVLLPLIPRFREACPVVTIQLLLSDTRVSLIDDRIDLAVRLVPEAPPDMVVSRLARTRYHVVATPDYWKRRPVSEPADLASHDCILFPYPGFRDLWRFRSRGEETEVPVGGHLEISAALALREAVLSGLGPALLADWLIGDDLSERRLVDPFPRHSVTATTFDTGAWILYPSRHYQPLKARRFIDILRSHLASATNS